jgi:hypothetical protein
VQTVELQKPLGGKTAAFEVEAEALDECPADRGAMPPGLDGDHEVAEEPLAEHALADAFLAVETLGSGAWERLLPPVRSEDVGAMNGSFGEGRGDAGWCRPYGAVVVPGLGTGVHRGALRV